MTGVQTCALPIFHSLPHSFRHSFIHSLIHFFIHFFIFSKLFIYLHTFLFIIRVFPFQIWYVNSSCNYQITLLPQRNLLLCTTLGTCNFVLCSVFCSYIHKILLSIHEIHFEMDNSGLLTFTLTKPSLILTLLHVIDYLVNFRLST